MINIDGWVRRESFPAKNKSVRQEETGTGCNSLSESECMALQGRPSKSKVETEFLSYMEFFPGNGQVEDPAFAGYVPRILAAYVLVPSREFQKSRCKIVAHSVK